MATLIWNPDRSRYEMISTYSEKDIPKAARFRWDPAARCWWTDQEHKAAQLVRLAKGLAKQMLSEYVEKAEQSLEQSRATDSNIEVPAPKGLEYRGFQKAGIQFAAERTGTLIGDEMGCVSGDAIIHVNRGGRGFRVRLSDAFNRINGLDRDNYNWDPNIPTYCRALCNGELRQHRVRRILYKGRKTVVRVVLKSGKSVVVTPDHEIAQPGNRWTPAEQLRVGDEVLTNGVMVGSCPLCGSSEDIITYEYAKFCGYCRTCMYRKLRENAKYKTGRSLDKDGYVLVSGQWDHPRARKSSQVYEHILVMENHLGRYIRNDEEVHHINGNKADNRIKNLKVTTRSEHKREHNAHLRMDGGTAGRGGKITFIPKVDYVTAVIPAAETDVYDIVMENPHRNFVADGVIVHNCGKTIQALGLINLDESIQKVLVICPASLKLNWRRESTRWLTRRMSVSVVNSKSKWPNTNVRIVNYDILKKFETQLNGTDWDLVIVDECHFIKNAKAQRSQRVMRIPAKKRLLLTGTPIVNRPVELWNLLKLLDPARWTNFFQFARRYCAATKGRWGWDFSGASNLAELHNILRSTIMIRRLKKDVLAELPPKQRQVVEVPTNGASRLVKQEQAAYDEWQDLQSELRKRIAEAEIAGDKEAFRSLIIGLKSDVEVAFTELSKCRHETAIAKTKLLKEHLKDLLESGQKVVVFAHHHDVIDQAMEVFGDQAVRLDGRMTVEAKQESVDRFQNDESVKVFVGSITAAGVGITLTASSQVVFLALDWVPGNMQQAEDRCVAEGQRVLTVDGWRPIEEIRVGDYVIGRNGRSAKVIDAWSRGSTKLMVDVAVEGWPEAITTTIDHRWLTSEGWKQAENLRPGDRVRMPGSVVRRTACVASIPFPRECRVADTFVGSGGLQKNGRLRKAPDRIDLDDESMFVFGYYVGDGFASTDKNKGRFVSFSGNTKTKSSSLSRCEAWTKRFGLRVGRYKKRCFDSVEIRAYSAEWASWFRSQFGHGAKNKTIPEWVFGLSRSQIEAFVEGLMASDGYYRKSRYEYSTMSQALASKVARLAVCLGYVPSVGRGSTDQYLVSYATSRKGTSGLVRSVSIRFPKKINGGRERVYDLTVEGQESFVVGMSVLHNCHRIGQQNSVNIQYLVLENSIDAKMAKTLVAKMKVIDEALDTEPTESLKETMGEISSVELARIEAEAAEVEAKWEARQTELKKQAEELGLDDARIQAIHDGLRFLAARCDGAVEEDGAGFNRLDTNCGKDLAARSKLTPKQAAVGFGIVRKYRGQLPDEIREAAGVN